IDEARIWDTARTQTDIRNTINTELSSPQTNLVARWGLNEGTGTTAGDTAGSAVNGTITNSNWYWTLGAPFDISFDPTITITDIPLAQFISEPGTPSAEQSYTVSGRNLTEDIVVTAPADFEISTTSGSGFDSDLTLSQSGGSVTATTIFIRFNRTTLGSSSGDISHVSSGATTENVAVSGVAATTVTFQDGVDSYTGTRDTYIYDVSPGTVRGSETTMVQDKNIGDERRSLLLFDLSSIPTVATIQSADLQFYVDTEGQGFNMHRMFASWDEATISFTSNGGHFNADGADAEVAVDANWLGNDGYTGYITVSVPASTIQDWVDSSLVNNGWLMIATHEDDGQQLRTREYATIADHPKLTVTYNLPDFTLDYTAGAGGNLTGNASQVINYGQDGTPITAVPDAGYHFVDWSDSSTDNPRTDTNVMANVNVTANFAIDTFTLDYAAGPNGSLTGTTSQVVDYGTNGTTVTAVPDTGYHFVNWSDSSTDNPRTDTNVMANVNVTANFADIPHLDIANPNGQDAVLTWLPPTSACNYAVHRSITPYIGFSILAPNTSTPYTDLGAVGDPGTNFFYRVEWTGCDSFRFASGFTNEVGEFDFAIVPGS
ncbi:MAG: DNRLRE domain-containing protein, partial [Anaerolineales bacterium]|nr:DNRLRE domain-containing protein [Anaerolineales bacterium]